MNNGQSVQNTMLLESGGTMNVIVHYPRSSNGFDKLGKNLAEVYAKTAIEKIQQMNLSEEQTKQLINMICDKVKTDAVT